MSSSPATGPSAELIRYTHGSTRIGCPACMNGNYSTSPKEASATGRPDRDPLATQDDPAKFLTQDTVNGRPSLRPAATRRFEARLGGAVLSWGIRSERCHTSAR